MFDEQMRQVVKILPNRALYHENLALYADYAGDFEAGEREVRALKEPSMFGLLALVFAQLGQGLLPEATKTYEKLGTMGHQETSVAMS